MGRLEEGFREYEIRNNAALPRLCPSHDQGAAYGTASRSTASASWSSANRAWATNSCSPTSCPTSQRAVGPNGKLQIAVDPRLVALFQRSFPEAEVGRYEDRTLLDKDGNKALRFIPFAIEKGEPDFYAPMGSTLLRACASGSRIFPHQAFLTPDPERVAAVPRNACAPTAPGPMSASAGAR